MGSGQPECPQRLDAIRDALGASGLLPGMQQFEAPLAEFADLLLAHDEQHLLNLQGIGTARDYHVFDYDTIMMAHSWSAALRAAGAGVYALQLLFSGQAQQVMALVRPPGHHAERQRAMGFCFVNSVAICAAKALHSYGLERVAIVDFDVHHGNGTEDIFAQEPRVLFASSFQHPLYPGTPFATNCPHIVNMPMPAGIGSAGYRTVLNEQLWPRLHEFQPQLLLVSAGFDAHQADPLGALDLATEDYHWLGEQLGQIAAQHCEGKLIALLEGGYNLKALGDSVVAFLRGLGAKEGADLCSQTG